MNSLPSISVVIPVLNEAENLEPLTAELVDVLGSLKKSWEIIFIDDGSEDGSKQVLKELKKLFTNIQVITFKKNFGQTSAIDAGFKAARGSVVITMDADLQYDPHDIPKLLEKINDYDALYGWRHKRYDSLLKRISSCIANFVRNALTAEDITDTGCSLKIIRSEYAKKIKLYNGMHRFLPTLIKMEGGKVAEVKVNHRPRKYGSSKYNLRNRILKSLLDLLAVCWMKKRRLDYEIEEDNR